MSDDKEQHPLRNLELQFPVERLRPADELEQLAVRAMELARDLAAAAERARMAR